MWMMPLHLHGDQKSDYGEQIEFLKNWLVCKELGNLGLLDYFIIIIFTFFLSKAKLSVS